MYRKQSVKNGKRTEKFVLKDEEKWEASVDSAPENVVDFNPLVA